jgi:hypothetical protein
VVLKVITGTVENGQEGHGWPSAKGKPRLNRLGYRRFPAPVHDRTKNKASLMRVLLCIAIMVLTCFKKKGEKNNMEITSCGGAFRSKPYRFLSFFFSDGCQQWFSCNYQNGGALSSAAPRGC